jgi:ABC-type antimicrobial peptide transport system ATPase subunit
MTIPLLPTARDIALQVRGLVTEFMTPAGALRAVDQVDLLLHRGKSSGWSVNPALAKACSASR